MKMTQGGRTTSLQPLKSRYTGQTLNTLRSGVALNALRTLRPNITLWPCRYCLNVRCVLVDSCLKRIEVLVHLGGTGRCSRCKVIRDLRLRQCDA